MTEVTPENEPARDISAVTEDARKAMTSGEDIREAVRDLVVSVLSRRPLESAHVREVAQAVLKGAAEAAPDSAEESLEAMKQAADGIDEALERAAEASKLAVEEARSRAEVYSETELKQAIQDIATLEDMYFEALEKAVTGSAKTSVGILRDLEKHLRRTGTSTGRTAREILDALHKSAQTARPPLPSDIVRSARAGTATIASIGSGILAGLAQSLEPKAAEDAGPPKSDKG